MSAKMTNKLIQENGFLSEEGKKRLSNMESDILGIFEEMKAAGANVQDIMTMASNMHKIIGDIAADSRLHYQEESNQKSLLWQMTDDEFEGHLEKKHGRFNLFTSIMSEAEKERYEPIMMKRIQKAMDDMEQDWPRYQPMPWSTRGF